MKIKSACNDFRTKAGDAVRNRQLQSSLAKLGDGFQARRAAAVERLPEFEQLRDEARDIKRHVMANLDTYLTQFEEKVLQTGGRVHWASTPRQARETVLTICRDAGAKIVTKGKSMVSEEIGLNDFLSEHGIEPVETDLGEYILQLRKEAPSHIVVPAVHLSQQQIRQTFVEKHKQFVEEDSQWHLFKPIEGFLLPQGEGQDEGITQNTADNLFLSPHPNPLPKGEGDQSALRAAVVKEESFSPSPLVPLDSDSRLRSRPSFLTRFYRLLPCNRTSHVPVVVPGGEGNQSATRAAVFKERDLSTAEGLVDEARQTLRRRFFQADVGITGANYLIAETGSTVIVTNEGNGDLTQTLPKVHIVLTTIERVIPTLRDLSTFLRLLSRSATGQEATAYVTLSTGPRREQDLHGPEAFHVVLLDNGRSKLLGTEDQDVLNCIRCGACMNHCPVYATVGGHAYGWVYPGPIGAALTPALIGLRHAAALPNASTFCGRCVEVCPVKIPLTDIMRRWRSLEFREKLSSPLQRALLRLWTQCVLHPRVYHFITRLMIRVMHRLGRRKNSFGFLPVARGWTRYRDFPAPQRETFHALIKKSGAVRYE